VSICGRILFGITLSTIWTAVPEARAQQDVCKLDPPAAGYKTLTINAQTNQIQGSLQYKNGDRVWIVVEDINPFVANYTLKVKQQPVTETAVTTFLSALGGIDSSIVPSQNGSKQTPNPAPPPAAAAPPPAGKLGKKVSPAVVPAVCDDGPLRELLASFNELTDEEKKVNKAIKDIVTQYATGAATYDSKLSDVKGQRHCKGIKSSADDFRKFLSSLPTPDELRPADYGGVASASDPIEALRNGVIKLGNDAKRQREAILTFKRSSSVNPACGSLLDANKDNLNKQDDFIDGLIGPSLGSAEIQALTDKLNQLKTIYKQWSDARAAVEKLYDPAQSGNPFVLGYALTDSQSDDDITLQPAPAVLAAPKPNSSSVAPTKDASTDTTVAAFDPTIHFGYGARFTLGAGLVVSFLENRQFTTANGQIAYQNNSHTRILPIAVLNSRFYDCDPNERSCLWVPQITVGITAKSDDKGTAPEYLIGPSWSFLQRQLFITAGAYAGQQQRLLGGLQVGQSTSLSAANLPVAKEYHWSGAIAITWKIK
jgi:hypothetical protein